MKTTIYAAYLPGSTTPDYIGSHLANPPEDSPCLKWRYANCIYLGQGSWIDRQTGALLNMPRLNQSTSWGATLAAMTPAQRLDVRIEIIEEVDHAARWTAEARAIRLHLPRFNTALRNGPDARKAKWNAYQRAYRKEYLEHNPEKAEAKRAKDRERIAAKRAAAKEPAQ